jgi:hypothetical protein
VRGGAWAARIGNGLGVTGGDFETHERRGREMLAGRDPAVADIEADLPRTFPYLTFFHDGGEWEGRLRLLLAAHVSYRPEPGYVQGMSFLAATLLLSLEGAAAFAALANLLGGERYYKGGYAPQLPGRYGDAFEEAFGANLPLLQRHFEAHGVSRDLYLVDWRLSLFCRALQLDVAVRVWDCYLREGEVYFVRASLGLLR